MIKHLYIYPVKGLSGEPLRTLSLESGLGIPLDRAVAISRKAGTFDPAAPVALTKDKFLMLMRDEALALLATHYDPQSHVLTIERDGTRQLEANLDDPAGREATEAFFAAYLNDGKLDPRVVGAPGHQFTDISVVSPEKMRAISLINLRSVEALASAIGKPVDHRRFRANIYYEGERAWEELDWIGSDLAIGQCRLQATMRTRRCAATQVNPDTAERDINVPAEIRKHFGHFDMGIYAEVQTGGHIAVGDAVVITNG
jgi:uncharacterized protein